MNMLDEVEGDRFHGTSESYSHLSDVEWSAIERRSSTVGEEAIWAMISTRIKDQQQSVISKFLQRELDESRAGDLFATTRSLAEGRNETAPVSVRAVDA